MKTRKQILEEWHDELLRRRTGREIDIAKYEIKNPNEVLDTIERNVMGMKMKQQITRKDVISDWKHEIRETQELLIACEKLIKKEEQQNIKYPQKTEKILTGEEKK